MTGCWASLEPQAAAALPRVSNVVINQRKDNLVRDLLAPDRPLFDAEPLARTPLPGLRQRTRAFIKVQDGCDNRCTFCITTIARGRSRSRPIADVCRDIDAALAGGAREIVLTGVHLGAWGKDLGMDLRRLVHAVLSRTDVPRLRLSSLEPWDLDREFFDLWEDPRLCPHLHLPLQSGCAATLRRMARRTTPRSFRLLLEAARDLIPEVAITTDVIAGFPGETEAEFEESLAFVREMEFAGGHAFTYSPRPGTAAARRPDQIAALRPQPTHPTISGRLFRSGTTIPATAGGPNQVRSVGVRAPPAIRRLGVGRADRQLRPREGGLHGAPLERVQRCSDRGYRREFPSRHHRQIGKSVTLCGWGRTV